MMNESLQNAPSIAREAKGLTQSLKESLKKHEPWDREIEFQRANLRRQYLQLIFVHPYAKESKDADHSLWMTTSYFNISAYKQRIAAADAIAHQSGSENHGHGRGHHPHNNHHGKPSGAVEHRKLVHRFRQFLAEEEKFWTSLIVRVVRVFSLEEARPALAALGILMSEPERLDASPSRSDRRNVFPAEDATMTPSHAQKEQKLVMLSKALVCLGDIARYREHYNESGGRPRAGKDFHEDSKSSGRGRGGRRSAIEQPPRPRNYSKAQECYERARLLVPDVGNACHQLAILANYQQDPFASVLQYYRAMCVKYPYDTAAANLDSTLSRNLEMFRVTLAKLDGGINEVSQMPKVRVERFKKSLVALHGLWKLDPAEADTLLPGHAASVLATFSSLVSERVLPTDIIWKTLVPALGALWRFRILRDPNAKRNNKRGHGSVEARILAHVLGVIRTLLQIGSVQLTDASTSPEPAVNGASMGSGELQADLAQNITAVFRRTLPALRIGSKWLKVHFEYLEDASARLGGTGAVSDADIAIPAVMSEFWASYTAFSSLLGKIFPIEQLPKMTVPLEEDVDVSGFAPLKRAMFDPSASSASGLEPGQSQVHPNEEQLMRIADLLEDAVAIRKFSKSPLESTGDKPVMSAAEPDAILIKPASPLEVAADATTPFALQNLAGGGEKFITNEAFDADVHSEMDDETATVSTRTDDDPVTLAMTAQLESDEDDDMEEQVLYPKNMGNIPTSTSVTNSFSTPLVRAKPLSPSKAVTAEDLVNDMMRPRGAAAIDSSVPRAVPSVAQLPAPPLLFGSGPSSAPTSIWSTTTLDSAALSANNVRVTGYPGAQPRLSPPASQTFGSGAGGLGLGQGTPVAPMTPMRSGYGHQRQPSQPLAYPSVSPTHQGPWGSQGTSHLGLSQSQSQPVHTLSPPSAPFVPQQPMVNARGFHQAPSPPYPHLQQQQQHPSLGFPGPSQPQFAQHQTFPPAQAPNQQLSPPTMSSGLPSQNTWSYAGAGSLNGIGAPLGPFAHDLPYAQSRLQQHPQMQRPGAWAPS